MTEFVDLIGNGYGINATTIKHIGTSFQMTITYLKDGLLEEQEIDDMSKSHFRMYETLTMALHPKKKDAPDRYTYIGDRTRTEKGNKDKKIHEKGVAIPVKKFANITSELKNALGFLLAKYIKECHDCYHDNGNTFQDESQVLSQIEAYAVSNCSLPIAPFIIRLYDFYDVDKIVEGSFNSLQQTLTTGFRFFFKDSKEVVPEKQLANIVAAYIRFMKTIAVMMTGILFEKRQATSGLFFYGILRQLNYLMKPTNYSIDNELIEYLKNYVDGLKPPVKPREKKTDKEEKKGKKTTKTSKSRSKKNEESEEESEQESEQESEPESEEEEPETEEKPEEKPVEEKKKGKGRPKKTKEKSAEKKEVETTTSNNINSVLNDLASKEIWESEANIEDN